MASKAQPGKEVDLRKMSDVELLRLAAALQVTECPGEAEPLPKFRSEAIPRAFWREHRAPCNAAALIAGTDVAALAAHAVEHAIGGPYPYLTLAGMSAVAGVRVAYRYRSKAKRRPRARRYALGAWGATTAAALGGTFAGVASGAGQGVMLAGGLVVAAPYLWRHRKRPPAEKPPEPVAALPAGPDPRVEAFLERFGGEQWCRDVEIHSVCDIADGFTFELLLSPKGKGTTDTVIGQIPQIAALYDVPADQVTVEHGARKSARRARVTVLTAEAAHEREQPWDGVSTYDPQTGCFDLGRFPDGATAHWLLHKPGSGAAGGVIAGVIGSGKALALDTPVPTPDGWATMGELRDGNVIYDETGSPCRVVRAWPVRENRPCYEVVFSDGSTVIADAEHRWFVDTFWSRLSESRAKRRTEQQAVMIDCTNSSCGRSFTSRKPAGGYADCPDCGRTIRVRRPGRPAAPWNNQEHKRVRPRVVTTEEMIPGIWARGDRQANYSVRVAAPLKGKNARLRVPPYTLGAWLGDGKAKSSEMFSADPGIIAEIEAEGEAVRAQMPPTATNRCGVYCVLGLRPRLRRIGVLGNKHIPVTYLRASEDQRRALLAGLLDTDGYCKPGGNVEFCNTSERLARDVLHLACTLGYKAAIWSKPARYRGKDCGTAWTVSFTPGDKVFRLPRKLARQTTATRATAGHRYITAINPVASVPVRCITVDSPSQLYLVGETCIPTHNTGTGHVAACETGLAKMCAECLGAGTCTRCIMQRIAGLWIGDPQRQPFGVWRGRADLTAWGPQASVRMLMWLHVAMRSRAAYLGNLAWTDHLGRPNRGKGWFDPEPALPLLVAIIDEWPMIIADKELAKIALPLAAEIVKEGRKVGIALILMTQIPDLSQLGERAVREMLKAFNVIAHRTDGLSKTMLGVQGDPTKLPAGVHGLGYISGVDLRPGATFRTKHLREHLRPGETGVDVREIAEWIGREPIEFDEGVMAPLRPLGYTGHGQVIEDGDLAGILGLGPAGAAAPAATATPPAPAPVPATSVVHLPLLAAVLAERGELDLWDVSSLAGVSAFGADEALRALAAEGLAVQTGPDRYRTAVRG